MEFEVSRTEYRPSLDHIRVATATPEVAVGDVQVNVNRIAELYHQASSQDVSMTVFPELSITGYSIQDLIRQPELLDDALTGLSHLADATNGMNSAAIVGLPVAVGNALYNCAAVVAEGQIKGIVPKQNLPNYAEFYEKRWFQTWDDRPNTTVKINDQDIPFGRQQLFEIAGEPVGIEICEDLWVARQPSIELTASGATIIANPSASPETVTKSTYRKNLVGATAARLVTGYVYASANSTESTSDIVMSGHSIISEAGRTIAEQPALSIRPSRLMIGDIDTQHIRTDRLQDTNYRNSLSIPITPTGVESRQSDLRHTVDALPFVPKGSECEIAERLESIVTIQAAGLASKMSQLPDKKVVLGLSGGLDSTLALLVALRAADRLGIPATEFVHTLTMPGHASSDRTQSNAVRLARSLGIDNDEIPIHHLTISQLQAIVHDGRQDITYENTQARIRTQLLFNKSNQLNALTLGTGDLSEIILGFCTYNGDHMSGYNPNASIPKTLIRSLVNHASSSLDTVPQAIIHDILATPISPELIGDGLTMTQKTEDVIGPYDLNDFYMFHLLRWMEPQQKIAYMAMKAFSGKYDSQQIIHWQELFMKRFYQNQWKRQAMPDGAKVGSLSASPRGDLRMAPNTKRSVRQLGIDGRNELQTRGILE